MHFPQKSHCENSKVESKQMGKSSHCPSFHLMLLQFLISFSLHTIWYSSDCRIIHVGIVAVHFLLVEDTTLARQKHGPVASQSQTSSHKVVTSSPHQRYFFNVCLIEMPTLSELLPVKI
jgi:hypothetical protein